jgi:diguanylate cyclase
MDDPHMDPEDSAAAPAPNRSRGGAPKPAEAVWLNALAQGQARNPPPPRPPGPVATQDWGDMLAAVCARLRSLAAAGGPAADPGPAPLSLASGVLQCADALDQLERSLRHELGRAARLELALFDARTALVQARTDLKGTLASEREARERALQDSLTALPNQMDFRGRLDQSMSRAAPTGVSLAVLYLDLDNFKAVNDSHGHDVGDALLRIVAARLRGALRSGDSVGRLGGDEFACLLANVPGRHELEQVVGKLAQALAAPVRIGNLDLRVSASVGIALWPGDGDNGDDLLRHADRAMYQAKRQGGGHAFFDSSTPG